MRLPPLRQDVPAFAPILLGLLLALVYSTFATWSVGAGFGGYDADGGWLDAAGTPTRTAPLEVQVTGHPAPWVLAVLAAVIAVTLVTARRMPTPDAARHRLAVGTAAAVLFVVTMLLVFSVLQGWLVEQAIARQHVPVLIGNAVLQVTRMPPG